VPGRAGRGDQVLGFELGADDYVTKPFSPRELLAAHPHCRASRKDAVADDKRRLLRADLAIDRERFEVTMGTPRSELTPKEFEVLSHPVAAPGRVFRREELLDQVWGVMVCCPPSTSTCRLRAKFSPRASPAPAIDTVRGVGYRFREARPRS